MVNEYRTLEENLKFIEKNYGGIKNFEKKHKIETKGKMMELTYGVYGTQFYYALSGDRNYFFLIDHKKLQEINEELKPLLAEAHRLLKESIPESIKVLNSCLTACEDRTTDFEIIRFVSNTILNKYLIYFTTYSNEVYTHKFNNECHIALVEYSDWSTLKWNIFRIIKELEKRIDE